ncbi:MAG TPA: hemolysin III family protein [Blastocatellia bacterium]|nr:hemolysin III family protein [Blastocatellia bacterium]
MKHREPDPAEEMANSLTHGFGLVLSLIGLAVLVLLAVLRGGAWHILGCSVFGASLVIMYLASTLYHSARSPRMKHLLRVVDHCCIYLLIAGTYTPFTLVILRRDWGWVIFGVVWGLALVGILCRILSKRQLQVLMTISYLLMGWMAVLAIKPLLALAPFAAVVWIMAGGVFYTIGVVFFSLEKMRYHHAIWHLFVLGGSLCHYLAVLFYVLPAKA